MDTEQVKKIAQLARINVSDTDLERVRDDLVSILDYVNALEEVDIDAVEMKYNNKNVLREDTDVIETGTYTEDILASAPDTKDGYIQVPKIL